MAGNSFQIWINLRFLHAHSGILRCSTKIRGSKPSKKDVFYELMIKIPLNNLTLFFKFVPKINQIHFHLSCCKSPTSIHLIWNLSVFPDSKAFFNREPFSFRFSVRPRLPMRLIDTLSSVPENIPVEVVTWTLYSTYVKVSLCCQHKRTRDQFWKRW